MNKKSMDVIVNKRDSKTAEIYLYGIIGSNLDIDTNILISEIEYLSKNGYSDFLFYVNSDGGEVVQGISLFNYLDRTDINVTWIIDGIAASMMALVVANPKHTVKAAKHAKFMYHRVQGYVYGNSSEVRAHADMIDTFEDSIINIMAERMGIDSKDVKKKYFTDGTDHWMSAEQAKALGLCDEIIRRQKVVEPDMKKLTNSRDIFNYYNNQIINYQKKEKMDKKDYALACGLSEVEDEKKILERILNIRNENKTLTDSMNAQTQKITSLEKKITDYEKARVTSLINKAVEEKKIVEEDRATYESLAEKDFDGVEKIINKLPGAGRVVNGLDNRTGATDTLDWDTLDKSGKLLALKRDQPDVYKELYNKKFNK